jgi:signal transduction histidine kinase
VPLADGRTLTMRTAIGVPSGWNPAAILSFLLSSLAVASVAIVSVRLQTRALRALADASDRFGRGETVPPLRTAAPAEVAAAIGAFNTMQARLNLFLRDRIRLLAGISHDLRTPLTTLRLKAEFIDDEAVRDDLVRTIDELTVICEATLAFTRAEATTEPTTTVDLADLVEQVSEAFRLAGGDVTVARIPPIGVACRPVALKRAVRNLVENALRYGERARISASQDPDAGVTITVEDDGPGLRPDQIEDAFLPFVRLEPSRSTETGGIGLGLAIARSIVKAHGGTLTLANLPAGGLRAEIRLPPGPEIRPATA